MKKILIVTVIGFAAVLSQAASITWSSGTFTQGLKGPDGQTLAGSTAYTATVYVYSNSDGSGLITSSSSSSATNKGAYQGTTTKNDFEPGNYYAKLVLTDNSIELVSSVAQFEVPTTGDANLNFSSGAGFVDVSSKLS